MILPKSDRSGAGCDEAWTVGNGTGAAYSEAWASGNLEAIGHGDDFLEALHSVADAVATLGEAVSSLLAHAPTCGGSTDHDYERENLLESLRAVRRCLRRKGDLYRAITGEKPPQRWLSRRKKTEIRLDALNRRLRGKGVAKAKRSTFKYRWIV